MEKSKNSINVEGGFLFCGGWNFSKSVSVGPTFIREMRVDKKKICLTFRFLDVSKSINPLTSSLFYLFCDSQCGNWGVSDKETAHLLQYFSTFRNEHFLW